MTLSIIIPCNQDTLQNQNLDRMFTSLNNQVHVDWDEVEVILVHPYAKYKFDMKAYPELRPYFRAYYSKNTTYGAIKQFGLEIAQGDYILFLMPNNILYSMTALIDVLGKCAESSIQDCVFYSVGDCLNVDPEVNEVVSNNSLNTLEGKLFKKEYLIDNNINFIENISSGEDLYFLQKLLNTHPQYSIDNSALVLQVFPTFSSIPMEEQYLNTVQMLSLANTENVVTVNNVAMDKIVTMLVQIYESLYSYDHVEYRRIVKNHIKNFILGLQNLININAIFSKCLEYSERYDNDSIIALNNDMSFYDFVVSIFVDETEDNNNEEDLSIESYAEEEQE
jgi:hypothetical protein